MNKENKIGVPDVGKHFEKRNPNSDLSLTSFLENEKLISLASLEDSSDDDIDDEEFYDDHLEAYFEQLAIPGMMYELHEEDIRLIYTFDQATGGTTQFEAHSDAQVLVLLDVTPDQSMVDEGMAREVINRIQKLRKKCNLVPTDEITVYYKATSEGKYLNNVIESHTDFIFATIKSPLKPYPVPISDEILIQEKMQLKGSDLEITLTKGSSTHGPACAYVNLNICTNGSEQGGVLLLENPKGDNRLDLVKLKNVVTSIFGVKNTELAVLLGETEIKNQTNLLNLSGKTLCVTAGSALSVVDSPSTLLCQYINLQLLNADPQECLMGTVGTLLLENPLGQNGLTHQGLLYEAAKMFGLRSRKLKLFLNETQTEEITEEIPMKTLNTKTVYVSVLPTTADF